MNNDTLYNPICLIYPGTFIPLVKEEEVQTALKHKHAGEIVIPPVNVIELGDLFKVEVAIPGVQKEDFLVHSDANVLSVCVLQKDEGSHEGEIFELHEFNYECFARHIILPGNADPEFASAEYKEGILRIFIPKSEQPGKTLHTRIVVY